MATQKPQKPQANPEDLAVLNNDATLENQTPSDQALENQIFGNQTKQTKPIKEEMVEIKKSTLEGILERLSNIEKVSLNKENDVFDPLATKKKEMDIKVPFYNKDGVDYMVLSYIPTILPNGRQDIWTFSHLDPVTKNKIDKATIQVVNIATGEITQIVETQDMFHALVRTEMFRVKRTETKDIDTTPSNETVQAVVYEENKSTGTIAARPTGANVRLSSKGLDRRFWVDYNGSEYEISSLVVNIK